MKLIPKKVISMFRLDKIRIGINEIPKWIQTDINHGILRIFGTPSIEHEGVLVI
jgi:hypothetical protein